jgi:integrase
MSTDISTIAKRAKLKPQNEPYWMKQAKGVALGYRVGEDRNTWRARVRDRAGEQRYLSLEVTPADIQLANGDEYDAAKKLCATFAESILGTGIHSPKFATIADAIVFGYIQWLKDQGRTTAAASILSKLGTCLLGNKTRAPDPLASIPLHKATDADFRAFLKRLGAKQIKPQTKNNYLKWVRAGLNRAMIAGYVGNPLAWKCLEPFANEPHESAAYLTMEQRTVWIAAVRQTYWRDAGADFARGMYAGGARPVDAARAKVKDFDPVNGTLTFYTCKGKTRVLRPYIHPLSTDDVAWLKELTKGKLPSAWLFPNPQGNQWSKKKWGEMFRKARDIANKDRAATDPLYLPAHTRAYSWRHSKITDMLEYGRIDSTKVAAQCGTSPQMISKTYYHVIAAIARTSMDMLSCAAAKAKRTKPAKATPAPALLQSIKRRAKESRNGEQITVTFSRAEWDAFLQSATADRQQAAA